MIAKEEIQKVLQKAAKKTLKNDGVHVEIVFEKQAEEIVKLFAIPDVVQQRELLIDFLKWRKGEQLTSETITEIDNFLADKSNL